MIFEGKPYNESHTPLSIFEALERRNSRDPRDEVVIQGMTNLMRKDDQISRLVFRYDCFPAQSASVQLVDGLRNSEYFWDANKEFSQFGLKLSQPIICNKMSPQIWHSHISIGEFEKVQNIFRGSYEAIWLGSPGLGRSDSPIFNNPMNRQELHDRQRKHLGDSMVRDWYPDVDPWHNIEILANLLLVRIAGERGSELGDFWVYCPNPAGTDTNDSIDAGKRLVVDQGFNVKFVSNPIAMWRAEEQGLKGAWVNLEFPINLSGTHETLESLGYL